MAFKPVLPNVSLPEIEEEVLKFWKKNKIFEKSIETRPTDKTWTFLDGPPFVTGMPHYGTLLSSIPKDLYGRYWTMKGYRVRRVWGWDGHGLPIENKVETKLKITRKKDIEEKVGVKKFIDECLSFVQTMSSEWEWYVDHIARWVDFKNAYKTWDKSYMESVMWVFKQMYEKGLVYKGLRVSLYCPHCSTPIANFEVSMDPDNYKEVTEPSNVYKYKLDGESDTYILAWSTTPWNKLVTPALAVNPKLDYVKVKQGTEYYILAKSTLKFLKPEQYKILEEFKGKKLIGKSFEPHYDFYKIDPGKRGFVIIPGDFVTAEDGTGVVTIAAYGEDDLGAMLKENIQIVLHVDDEGKLKPFVPKWAGRYYLDINSEVNEDLKQRGFIYREDPHTHTVPTCWRCHTRLLYAPQDAWYINVQKLKPLMEKTNREVNWYPAHFKLGRFLKSMQMAPDWCISRSRYWGSPVPVWECKCGKCYVPESIADLEKMSGTKVTELHKPEIDEIYISCDCGKKAKRVTEVLDSWVEAGSASFAERHFPFSGNELKDFFPPDFIVEYTGQIRAWFYVLHVITNSLYESKAFKNVVVTGVILGTDGRKMSKNFGNYPDPKEMLQKHGGDALRLYLMGSPVMRGEDVIISELEYRNQVRGTLLILWNVYNFFVTYANLDHFDPTHNSKSPTPSVLDRWILALSNQLLGQVTTYLEKYDTISAIEAIRGYVTDLSVWYIRRSRDRVGPTVADQADKYAFYFTAYKVLSILCQIMAPFTPFITESIYKNLTGAESVHLSDWPKAAKLSKSDTQLIEDMKLVRKIVEMGLSQRKTAGIKVRQPLRTLRVNAQRSAFSAQLLQLIKDELNVRDVVRGKGKELSVDLDLNLDPELLAEGRLRELIRQVQEKRKGLGARLDQKIKIIVPRPEAGPALTDELLENLKRQTLATTVKQGRELKIELI